MEGYCITLPKPKRKLIPAPYSDNNLNHDTNKYLKKNLFHVQYIMPYVVIKINGDIAMLVTLMLEGIIWRKLWSLNAIPTSYCDNFTKYET